MLNNLISAVENRLELKLDRKRFLLIGNAFSKFSVFLYFADNLRIACIAKIACNEAALRMVQNEYQIMEFLSASPINGIQAANPMGTLQLADQQVFLQEYVESHLMVDGLPLFRRTFLKRHFSIAADNLAEIYSATRQPRTELGTSYSKCFQHGDFWLGNLGVRPNRLVLYDLEFSRTLGLPLYDLFHFGIYYFRVLSNIGTVRVTRSTSSQSGRAANRRQLALQNSDIHTVFGSPNQYSKIMYNAIFSYASRCQIHDVDALGLLLTFVGQDRQIDNLPDDWEAKIESTYQLWRTQWSES